MKIRTGIILLFLFMLPALLMGSETSPAGQRSRFANAADAAEKIEISISLGEYYETTQFDSALFFFTQAYELARKEQNAIKEKEKQSAMALQAAKALRKLTFIHGIHGYPEKAGEFGRELLLLASEISDTFSIVTGHIAIGNSYLNIGQYPLAAESYHKAYDISTAWKNNREIAKALQNLGIVYYYMGNLSKAAAFTHEALTLYSELENRLGEAGCLLTLGNIISDQTENIRALNYYNQAYSLFKELNHEGGMYNSIMNIGAVQLSEGRYREAIEKFGQARDMAGKINDLEGVVKCLHNMGMAYSRLGNPGQALEYYQEALTIARTNNFKHLEANTLNNMAGVNNNLQRFGLALSQATQGLRLSQEIQSIDDQLHSYRNLSRAYEGQGQFQRALENHKLYKLFSDSLHRIETRREVSRLEAIYQNEQMQQEVELKNAQLEKQNLELDQKSISLSRQRMIRNVLLLWVFLLAALALFVYLNLRRRKRLNNLISAQKGEIEEINQTLRQQNSEIALQRDEITSQKGIIEEKNTALVSSIHYAKTIQNALLPSHSAFEESFAESFVIFQPKEIVSGDFFWVSHQNEITLLAVADSTGHGVPGAFMSLLGISFLNEFVARRKYSTPAGLLNELRQYMIQSLHKQETTGNQQDGIEMALVAFDYKNNTVAYSGARTPIYIASKAPITLNGKLLNAPSGTLHKIKADTMPLAFHKKMNPFTDYTLALNPGDVVYLMTDGFADQFSCKSGERFTSQRLISQLNELQNLPLHIQKEKLLESLHNWKMDGEQVDDITVVGVRVS